MKLALEIEARAPDAPPEHAVRGPPESRCSRSAARPTRARLARGMTAPRELRGCATLVRTRHARVRGTSSPRSAPTSTSSAPQGLAADPRAARVRVPAELVRLARRPGSARSRAARAGARGLARGGAMGRRSRAGCAQTAALLGASRSEPRASRSTRSTLYRDSCGCCIGSARSPRRIWADATSDLAFAARLRAAAARRGDRELHVPPPPGSEPFPAPGFRRLVSLRIGVLNNLRAGRRAAPRRDRVRAAAAAVPT